MALLRDRRPAAQSELVNVVPAVFPASCEQLGLKHDWQTTGGMMLFRCARCFTYGFARMKPGKFHVARVRPYRCTVPNCNRDARLKDRNWSSTSPSWCCEKHRERAAGA